MAADSNAPYVCPNLDFESSDRDEFIAHLREKHRMSGREQRPRHVYLRRALPSILIEAVIGVVCTVAGALSDYFLLCWAGGTAMVVALSLLVIGVSNDRRTVGR